MVKWSAPDRDVNPCRRAFPITPRWSHTATSAHKLDTCHNPQVGSDDDGYAVRLHLKWFLDYVTHPDHADDDSPLYIFDGTFADRSGSRAMGGHYRVPAFFREDLFRLVGERRRPPYRCASATACRDLEPTGPTVASQRHPYRGPSTRRVPLAWQPCI